MYTNNSLIDIMTSYWFQINPNIQSNRVYTQTAAGEHLDVTKRSDRIKRAMPPSARVRGKSLFQHDEKARLLCPLIAFVWESLSPQLNS